VEACGDQPGAFGVLMAHHLRFLVSLAERNLQPSEASDLRARLARYEEAAVTEAEQQWLDRLAEWDENRVWMDGSWWEVEHYGAEDGGVCTDVVIRLMDPQPSSVAALASAPDTAGPEEQNRG